MQVVQRSLSLISALTMTHKSADYPTHRSTNPLRQRYVHGIVA